MMCTDLFQEKKMNGQLYSLGCCYTLVIPIHATNLILRKGDDSRVPNLASLMTAKVMVTGLSRSIGWEKKSIITKTSEKSRKLVFLPSNY